MTLDLSADSLPLRSDGHGTVRVGRTRVTLETLVGAFNDGSSAEEIALGYPSLALADVYTIIGFYLRHRDQVDLYLESQGREADRVRLKYQARLDQSGLRERLLARLPERSQATG